MGTMTRVYRYGALEPRTNLDVVLQQIGLVQELHNLLIEVERWFYDEREKLRARLSTEYAELNARIRAISEEIDAHFDERRERRCGVGRDAVTTDLDAKIKPLKSRRKRLYEERAALQDKIVCEKQYKDSLEVLLDEKKARAKAHTRVMTTERGLFGLNAELAIEQVDSAVKLSRGRPKFKSWKGGEGGIRVRHRGGLAVEKVWGNGSRGTGYVQIEAPPDKAWESRSGRMNAHTVMRMRVGSEGPRKRAIWAEIPILMHRPLPEGSRIKTVKLMRVGVGTSWKWSVSVCLDIPVQDRDVRDGIVALDFGWRQVDDGLRIAMSWDGRKYREWKLPQEIADKFAHVDYLKSIRTRQFDEVRGMVSSWVRQNSDPEEWARSAFGAVVRWYAPAAVVARREFVSAGGRVPMWLEEAVAAGLAAHRDDRLEEVERGIDGGRYDDAPTAWVAEVVRQGGAAVPWDTGVEVPAWLREKTASLPLWRSSQRLTQTYWYWARNRFSGDLACMALLRAWAVKERHLMQWEAAESRKAQNQRLDLYRRIAKSLVLEYGYIALEGINLKALTRTKDVIRKDEPSQTSRRNRTRVAKSVLYREIVSAAQREGSIYGDIPAENTSITCNGCGTKTMVPVGDGKQFLICTRCSREADRDENAARNIWDLARAAIAANKFGPKRKKLSSDGENTDDQGGGRWQKRKRNKVAREQEPVAGRSA